MRGEVQVVGQRDDQGGAVGHAVGVGEVGQRPGDELDHLRGDAGQELGQVVGVTPVAGDEDPDDLGGIHGRACLGLEAEPSSGEDDLVTGGVACENHVVVEDSEHGHALRLPRHTFGHGRFTSFGTRGDAGVVAASPR